jgi:RNA polymerase sigma-B factor
MAGPAASSRSDTIQAHLPLVRSIAQRYVRQGEPLEDLVQAGTIGLIKAVDRFDPGRDRDLAALARPSIEGEIRHHLRDGGAGPHVPRTDRELAARVRAAATDLTARLRRPPSAAELAVAAGVDEERVAQALRAQDAGRALALADADASSATGRSDTDAAEARVLLEAGWDGLDERERRLLVLRYREDRSQSEIARELGLSQAHVSRLLRAAVERLRAVVDPDAATAEADDDAVAPKPSLATTVRPDGRSGRLLLRLPRSLHTDLAAAARHEGVPLNTFIAGTLAAAVGWQDPDADPSAPSAARGTTGRARPPRLLVVNAVVVALAAAIGLALLLVAWLA